MSSKVPKYDEAYVWVWLPGETAPVVAGRLYAHDGLVSFNYGRSFRELGSAIPLYLPELPLKAGELPLLPGLTMPGCIRDAAPDAWGRRVILNRKFGVKGDEIARLDISELTFLLESGSDRIGALDFQFSPMHYEPRALANATLEELVQSAERVEKGIPLTPELDQALHHGSSIGGARPKALIEDDAVKHVAKFSSSADLYSVVKGEFIAMRLAALCGIRAASVSLVRAAGNDVLLVERFDRIKVTGGWQRKSMVSALTMLALDEMMARYASYQDLAEIIRHRFTAPSETLRELFSRIVFNILCGNTDDHARNHAAFWDGARLTLTPAYDICPQARSGQEASQAMLISGNNRMSRIASCLEAAHHFLLSAPEALAIVEGQLRCIAENWPRVSEEATLSGIDRNLFWGRQFLNPYAFTALEGSADVLRALADELRNSVHA
ncbi:MULTISPECIES: HipA domain-containing protein [unclassified Mesorhizobium]|uniref:type II toxin-antitoxin system HipA family toxin n=1 Tax=unclassified Mesorhizobium TaxID=325217 RepID=UPI000FCAE9A6|nr:MULTISPECIES: HipA domain-containing protein [unclassified Mesorhizobium]RUU26347.1 type II toxin-antitoxin system HipA family toxin [Mesorhizobium sp. M6A.T.Ce.TU.016.01.1.1]RVB76124.1 type II toxin-antitoxin system HipA family toxin [Mesorhizobium sp. M6A.T.Cr.TU.014.01.1.1]RWB68042.1 MAG: type II toxin-antitoxin system HipA family toxin [Mesorhizobium sp.]RWP99391.1 MAG: type II toxin-antitoxin system HipA family toxin [Mesorhizobium sp.]RWQ04061.1 MAG: type II toxin-antitoxin system Hip